MYNDTDERKLRKRVFNNPNIPSNGKLSVARTYLFSKGCFNCGTWPNLNKVVYLKFPCSIMSIYRSATQSKRRVEGNISDLHLLTQYALVSPANILRISRISVLIRVVSKKVVSLLNIINMFSKFQYGWAHDVLLDLKWLALFEEFKHIKGMELSGIVEIIQANVQGFGNSVRKVLPAPFMNIPHDVEDGKNVHCAPTNVPISCPCCNVILPSLQQFGVHMKAKHNVRNPMALYLGRKITHCNICLKEFHTRECALNHLRYRSQACRMATILQDPVMTSEEVDQVAKEEAPKNKLLYANAKKRYHKDSPCVQLPGPLPLVYFYRFGSV